MVHRPKWSRFLERLALTIERPVNQLIGNHQLNPFYHTGSISIFLLIVVAFTGFYIYLFYQYGFEASYLSVQTRIEGAFLARTARAIHRYASGALAVTIFLHALRMLFMRRFRGARALAWATGVLLVIILWLAGVTGYVLVWDEQAQLIIESVVRTWRGLLPILTEAYITDNSWWIMGLVLAIHVLLLVISGVFIWLHVRHLKRPRWLPEAIWMGGAAVVLLVMGVLLPVGTTNPYSFLQLAGRVEIDPLFLFFIPYQGTLVGALIWLIVGGVLLWGVALPYWKRADPAPTVRIDADNCTGCTKCAQDCPYNALEMVERADETAFKLLAVVDPAKCVGCGICVGSCDTFEAMALGDAPTDDAWVRVAAAVAQMAAPAESKLILTCDRHATMLNSAVPLQNLVSFPCTGAIPPHILPKALTLGLAEVEVVGCPPYDCVNRTGNLWQEQRVTHERVPRLRKQHDADPITAAWLPPDQFNRVLPLTVLNEAEEETSFLDQRAMFDWLTPRNLIVTFVLLAFVLIGQIWLTGVPFVPKGEARVDVVLTALNGRLNRPKNANPQVIVTLYVDGVAAWEVAVDSADFYTPTPIAGRIPIPTGEHHIKLQWWDEGIRYTYFDETVQIADGEILLLQDIAR
jgi:ferredoxin